MLPVVKKVKTNFLDRKYYFFALNLKYYEIFLNLRLNLKKCKSERYDYYSG
jgi:hypothetical protein